MSAAPAPASAAAAAVIWRAVTFYFYLIAGAPVFFVMAGRSMLGSLLKRRSAITCRGERATLQASS